MFLHVDCVFGNKRNNAARAQVHHNDRYRRRSAAIAPSRAPPRGENIVPAFRRYSGGMATIATQRPAQAHAHFIDTNEGVRLQAEQQTYRWTHLF